MATAIITKDKLITNAYNNILAYVDDRSKVADPRSPSGTQDRQFVYDRDPLSKGFNFGDYPYIVLKFPNLVQSNPTLDGKHKLLTWTCNIIVRAASDNNSNTLNSIGAQNILNIADDLASTFNNNTNRVALRALNVYNTNLEKTNSDSTNLDSKELYEDSYQLTFDTRLEVSD